ncbi:hypothetical protein [Duganella sp. FT27W]|uniref:hypothetical protein n=1 Tax=Duganella sp. FT27W TaxID=2654636 RepID=UPI00128BAB84|nr:hypothetical protein [Duganella sp. FT27W]MPQ56264.1 hypothetical protein [Duganella sp. FT27W]
MTLAVTRIPSHQDRDADFNSKAPHYKTADFTTLARSYWPHLPAECVRVVFDSLKRNIKYQEDEPLFRVYRTVDDDSFIGHYFARALKDFTL